MSRLTYKNKRGYFEACGDRTGLSVGYDGSNAVVDGDVVDRLAAYEDAGLEPEGIKDHEEMFAAYRHVCGGKSPEEIVHALELMEAERNGRLEVCFMSNEIEKAVERFHYGITHDIFSEPVTTYAKLAVETLREKQERDKGCEYCNPNPYGHGEAIKPLIRQVFNDKAQICTKISGDGLHTLAVPSSEDTSLAKRYSKCQIIHFCPMCGKRLEVEP